VRDDDRERREEQALRELIGTLRTDVRASPELRANVMSTVNAVEVPLRRRLLQWLTTPRVIRLSPARGGLAVATIVALLVPIVRGPPTSGHGDGAGDVVTRFVFIAPEASAVQVTGDFVDWSPQGIALLNERGTGVWTVDIPLEPGVYQYAFVVDGREWRPDPRAVSRVDDGFGRENSIVIVSRESDT
jgi:hypothetical protein